MAAPMTDIHVKHVLELGIKTILADPDRHLADIFGDSKLDPHAALYGNRTIAQVKNWMQSTRIPVILGFDLVDSQMPAVTVNLAGSSPTGQFIGDEGGMSPENLEWQTKEVLVPAFSPASAVYADDRQSITITLPTDMTFEHTQLVMPGLMFRDADNREYNISADKDENILILERSSQYPLDQINLSRLEVVSPVIEARYSRGAMVYDEQVVVVVHGHSARNEGLWLYYIVMWTLLKFRPVLTGTFGLDLSTPSASDFSKDDSFLGEQVWRRYIQMTAKAVWSWETARQKDVLGLLLTVKGDQANAEPSKPVKID
jgi:hypothetical protein